MATATAERPEIRNVSTGGAPATGASAAGKAPGGSTQIVVTQIKKRKRRRRIAAIAIAALVVVIVAMWAVNNSREKATIVQTETVSRRTIKEVVQATGKIQPEVQVKISPEVPGEIIALPHKEGDQVRKGEVVARIKPTSFEAQYEQGAASVNSSKARQEQARASMLTAKSDLDRAKTLRAQNLLSPQEFDAATNKYQVAEATFNASKYDVAAAESALKQLSESLNKTTVYAPMAGVITSLISQLGEKVVGTSQFSGTEMMTISDLSVMNAMVEVDENDVVNIKIGDSAEVAIDAFPNRTFHGTVIEIANSAKLKGAGSQDQSTNFDVKIRLNDFDGADLRPGMSCTSKIQTQTKQNVLSVPMAAVTSRDVPNAKVDSTKPNDKPTVVFVNDHGKAKLVPVKVGISDNAYIEIVSGLDGNEEIVKGNFNAVARELQDKKAIKVENAGGAKPSADAKAAK